MSSEIIYNPSSLGKRHFIDDSVISQGRAPKYTVPVTESLKGQVVVAAAVDFVDLTDVTTAAHIQMGGRPVATLRLIGGHRGGTNEFNDAWNDLDTSPSSLHKTKRYKIFENSIN